MECVLDRGPAADVPAAAIMETFERCYPALTANRVSPSATRFRREAKKERGGADGAPSNVGMADREG